MRDGRTVADYDLSTVTDMTDAEDALAKAMNFLDLCRRHFGMTP